MQDEFGFEPWLGSGGRDKGFIGDMLYQANRNGRALRMKSKTGGFDGSRIGRGAGIGRVLRNVHRSVGTPPHASVGTRTVRTITKIGKNRFGDHNAASAHLRYLERPGVARDGGVGELYDQDEDKADRVEFARHTTGDRHHFRIIVCAEDGVEYDDLRPLIRRLMTQVQQDLNCGFEWIAADHYDTALPHSHIVVRGRDDRDNDVILAREYLHYGLPTRAAELIARDLGPRTANEIQRARGSELFREGFTALDADLLQAIDSAGIVSAFNDDLWTQSQRTGRLAFLQKLGIVRSEGQMLWRLHPEFSDMLQSIAERREPAIELATSVARSRTALMPDEGPTPSERALIGKLLAIDAATGDARDTLVLDGVDGVIHHLRIASTSQDEIRAVAIGSLVRIAIDPQTSGIPFTPWDNSSALINVEDGLGLDQSAVAPGTAWPVAHGVELLTSRSLNEMIRHEGATWLDRELINDAPQKLGRGFGAEVARALDQRRQWLVDYGLGEEIDGTTYLSKEMLLTLENNELRDVASQISSRSGLSWSTCDDAAGSQVTVNPTPVKIGDRHYVILANQFSFHLVPWEKTPAVPSIDTPLGRHLELDMQ